MSEAESNGVIRSLSLVGRVEGAVRQLPGFDRKRHTVPDQVNGATQSFLAKLAADELAEEAESLFQSARQAFGYRRREISLTVDIGAARLETKDFVMEIRYELVAEDPSQYAVETELTRASSRDLLDSPEFAAAVGRRFDRLRCVFRSSVKIEEIIDAVEADESGEMAVDYPSDCQSCSVRIDGLDADVVFTSAGIEIRCARLATAGELLAAYERIGQSVGNAAGMADLAALHF